MIRIFFILYDIFRFPEKLEIFDVVFIRRIKFRNFSFGY